MELPELPMKLGDAVDALFVLAKAGDKDRARQLFTAFLDRWPSHGLSARYVWRTVFGLAWEDDK